MLPCLGYPGLKKKYPHLYGHYGTAWQNQRREFDKFPGAILMTSNCIQRPKNTYKKNIFTTGTVGWPGVTHVSKKNLEPLVERALELPGYPKDMAGAEVMVGFGHKSVLGVADKVVAGVKDIHLGPTLPAFVSPNVLDVLVKNYNIKPNSTPNQDLKAIPG